jgi:uncharacterized protein involved in type VI secretion and phage assembly
MNAAIADIERVFEELEGRHLGKYRGLVTANDDPLKQGRIEVKVPAVLGQKTLWALPCVAYAGPDVGLLMLPPVGASVWVEFEAGDRSHPIWAGCFWAEGELPADADPQTAVLRTPGATLRISHDGVVEIETTAGTKLVLSGSEIKLEAPAINQSANGGASGLSAGGFEAQNGAFKVV